ncbi:Sulfatase [Butyrivibrio sp. ob235]|uniref:sulfatase-like hydrolase/transferase n=1 Tax=Butyrivibrio sp. ob235 TaxID=1761780 RepID=UPI0008D3EF86|nr:sulfatase-like hydrolase/transferase [Butyrivibrio sp. ob235]SEL81773.1 Sulfatase [Butyrivibrio sp. ob235]
MKKENSRLRIVVKGILWILIFFATLLGFSLRWMLTTWGELTFEEVLFQLTASLEGTGNGMVFQYILFSVVPTIVVVAIVLLFRFVILKNSDKKKYIMPVSAVLCVGLFIFMFVITCRNLGIVAYIKGQLFPGTFIEEHYVNPEDVDIELPEKKRNLIYIYMESGEVTFADKENGGAFDQNVIPELTALAEENEDFSGKDPTLNGGVALYDTTWTMAAIFAQSAGLPLKTSLSRNGMVTMESFFPEIVTLGDVLENNGYKQVFMLGSPVVFGGRDTFFNDHGSFESKDYYYMQEKGKFPKDYYVFWGYEDAKLFEYAKEELGDLSKGEDPFNLTLLTVDTHFEDGYVCQDCENKFDDQYSNVFACSSKRIAEFVEWAKQQDFYKDTTIVIVGDHPTMDLNYCDDVDVSYQRKVYTTYINSAVTPETDKRREYSTFDMFPTTLAAMGATIPGNRLGLGTNLFSSEDTLLEEFGKNSFNLYLQEKSVFLDKLMDTGDSNFVPFERIRDASIDVTKTDNDNEYNVKVRDILGVGEGIESVEVELFSDKESESKKYIMDFDGFTTYSTNIDKALLDDNYGHLKVIVHGTEGGEYTVIDVETDIYLLSRTYLSFLHKIKEYQDAGRDMTILCAGQSAASSKLKQYIMDAMNEIGFETDFNELNKQSYYGIIDKGTVTEKLSRGYLTYKGTLSDGTAYKINSGGYYSGRISHIILDGVDYTRRLDGFNYFIFDNSKNRVISTDGYNTQMVDPDMDLRMTSYDPESKKMTIRITQIKGVRKWDRKDNSTIKYFDPADQSSLRFTQLILDTEDVSYSAELDLSAFTSDRIQLQVNSFGDNGKVRVGESITSLEYLEHYDIAEYFDYLKTKENIAIFLSVRATGLELYDEPTKESLKALGLAETDKFASAEQMGYAAVIDKGRVVFEQIQDDAAGEGIEGVTGKLADGTEYEISSYGLNSGDDSKIVLNGTNYSLNRDGINIVVYDYEKGEVVDTASANRVGEYIVSR